MKKLLSFLLVALLCLAFICGCSKNESDIPVGMKLASDPKINTDYTLYVPEAWVCDMTTGITSAYVSSVDHSNISITYEVPKVSTIKEYWENSAAHFEAIFESFEIVEEGVETKLGNANAARYTYKATYGGEEYQFIQLFAVRGVHLYTFTYTALNEESELGYIPFDKNLEHVYKIIENFRFN